MSGESPRIVGDTIKSFTTTLKTTTCMRNMRLIFCGHLKMMDQD